MNEESGKKLNINIVALTFAIILLFAYLVGSTFAWFTDESDLASNDDVAVIKIQLINGSFEPITDAPSFVYTGQTSQINLPIHVKTISTIDTIVKVMIMAYWSNNLPVYIPEVGNTVQYNLFKVGGEEIVWDSEIVGGAGFDYLYYKYILPKPTQQLPLSKVQFLTSIQFPTLPAQYMNETVTINVAVTGLQATPAGVDLWASGAPLGWDPLNQQ